ncbi:MAG TPA: universal stress protein [Streptosporangiaceae bacterium]|nr:universal stress protein [Streptosporangiaceae bacterium]
MRTTSDHGVRRIVVGVDGSASSRAALQWAVWEASLTGASVDAVIAWHYPVPAGGYGFVPTAIYEDLDFSGAAQTVVDEMVASTIGPDSDVNVRRLAIRGDPARVLLGAAQGADMLVVGSRGHGAFASALLGSVSQRCVHHAACPVVVIHGMAPAASATASPRHATAALP